MPPPRFLVRCAVGAVVLATGASIAAPAVAAAPGGSTTDRSVRRVLVVSLPRVGWADVTRADTPAIARFAEQAAIADLTLRGVRHRPQPSDSYTMLGAGARAVGEKNGTGEVFEARDRALSQPVPVLFRQRTGRTVTRGVVDLSLPDVVRQNDDLPYDAVVGALGDALAAAGVHRNVIANADRVADPARPADVTYDRAAAEMLMGSAGTLRAGTVGRDLDRADPGAPYGVRQDPARVVRAFERAWSGRSVVLVEASDLERAAAFSGSSDSSQADAHRLAALRRADALFAQLLRRVDLHRDAVLLIGPTMPSGDGTTVAALAGPGIEPGWLRSSTTRHDGFVHAVDVAPTVLDLLGIERPEKMEGRAFTVSPAAVGTEATAARIDDLVGANDNGLFRDDIVEQVAAVFITLSVLLAIAAIAVFELGRGKWRRELRWAALLLLGMLLGTSLAAVVDFASVGVAAYWVFVVAVGAVFTAACELAGRRAATDPVIIGLGVTVAFHVVDALTGARFEFNAAYGYSPTVGIRYSGIGNMTFAVVSSAVVLLAGLLTARFGTRGRTAAVVSLAATFVVFASPLWGQDFGSALALVPPFALLVLLLYERRVRIRHVVYLGVALVVSGIAFGLFDLLRPSAQRTHVGRFFEKIGNEGFSGFWTVIHRKIDENLDVFTSSRWIVLIPLALGLVLYLALRPPSRLAELQRRLTGFRAALLTLPVLAVLGLALNDSGIAIPGMMLLVVDGALAYLAARLTQ